MKRIVFLNMKQKEMLDAAGIGLSSLADSTIEDVLSEVDIREIQHVSRVLSEPGKLLARHGFSPVDSDTAQPYNSKVHYIIQVELP